MSRSIGALVRDCLESFDSVQSDRAENEVKADASLVVSKIRDEQDKFKVWSGNIGAHRNGMSSLDYRLRDASNLRKEVQSLLEDLLEALTDVNRILNGEVQPWDDEPECPPSDNPSEQQDDAASNEFEFESELEQLLADISETVKYLYKVSAGLRSTSQHDRLMSSLSINTTHYETFDIEHVRNKHPNIDDEIAQRLGKAISNRRHYFKYRESHRGKLGNGLEAGDKVADGKSTIASSLPNSLKKEEKIIGHIDIDENSESGFTQTSFATSVANTAKLRVPPLPKEAKSQEYFECPFCFMIFSAQTRQAWKKHVFGDLRPYVCLYPDCPVSTKMFARRHHWVEHLRQQHWRMWKCPFDSSVPFLSQEPFKSHVRHNHHDAIDADQMGTFMTACERPCLEFMPQNCQFCDELIASIAQYQRHIGHHLEQLALFALPISYDDDKSEEEQGEEDVDQGSLKELTESDSDTELAGQQGAEMRHKNQKSKLHEVKRQLIALEEIGEPIGLFERAEAEGFDISFSREAEESEQGIEQSTEERLPPSAFKSTEPASPTTRHERTRPSDSQPDTEAEERRYYGDAAFRRSEEMYRDNNPPILGDPLTLGDLGLMRKGHYMPDAPIVYPISQDGAPRLQPETSEAAIRRFEEMVRDNDSVVSRAASWGTRRRSLQSLEGVEIAPRWPNRPPNAFRRLVNNASNSASIIFKRINSGNKDKHT